MRVITNILIIITMVLLSCYQLAESFATQTTQTSQTSTKINDDDTSNTRVFVAGISHTCTEQAIRSTLSKFGSINEVTIVGQANDTNACSKRKAFSPYAFVTFDSSSSAKLAIDAPKPSPPQTDNLNNNNTTSEAAFYKEIQAARSIKSRKRSNAARLREEEILSKVTIFGKEANCIIQVQLTHLDRLVDYLNRNYNFEENSSDDEKKNDDTSCKVVGTANSASKNISLLFLSCTNPSTLTRTLITDPILVRAINKSYIVTPGQLVEGNLATEDGCDEFAKSVYESISKQQEEGNVESSNVSLRLKIFPPKYQSKLLKSFDTLIEQAEKKSSTSSSTSTSSSSINIDPKDFTHMLSIVEIYQYKGRGWENNDVKSNNLYMWGLSEASLNEDVVDANNLIALDGNLVVDSNNDGNDEDGSSDDGEVEVGRAYYKLKEAIETYKSSNNNEGGRNKIHSDLYDESVVALDCGSAPGGWTKYLIEHFNCKTVYSIDPGKLAKSVSKLDETKHIQMKIQDAIPLLLKDNTQVKIWVSDMCLHNMESQVDLLLMAKDSGLLSSDCFVVLTLKCIVGHSKSAYDAQVKKVVDKLCDKASMESVEIFHLFSNRSGERTVMGYLK